MCGICGFTGPDNRTALEAMVGLLEHRGPDDSGFLQAGQISMGFRRLSILDLQGGKQPIHNEDKTIWSVFNGEIYNFASVRRDLLEKGHRLYTSHSDSEVFVHLYEEYGLEFMHRLNGMFAVAIWDERAQKMVLIRDRMGVKPLFYAVLDGQLVFASEIKAILAHPSYRRDMNLEAIFHYFSFKHVPSPHTAFKGIFSLLPGEVLVFEKGQVKKDRYWKIRFQENNRADEEEVKNEILNILDDAVKMRMNCDVPFGAYLSGGVDSSAVVALMTKHHNKPVKTFSLGYEDNFQNKENDLFFARKVAQTYKTEHYEYIMSHKELLEDVDKVIRAFDQPFSGTVSTFFLSKLIRQHVKVAISGDGADELFGSYLSHRLAQPMFHFASLREKYRKGLLTGQEKKRLAPFEDNLDYIAGLFEISGGNPLKWRNELLVFKDAEKMELLSPSFLNSCPEASTFALLEDYFNSGTTADPLNQVLEMEWNSFFPDQVLAFIDFLSMAHAVEVRSPFLDYRLIEYVATIPGNLKIKQGKVKDPLKEAVKSLLPRGIAERPKEGFVLPVFDWMMQHLRGYMLEILSPQRLEKHGLFNNAAVQAIVSRYTCGDKSVAAKVWNLMMFQVWWEEYFA